MYSVRRTKIVADHALLPEHHIAVKSIAAIATIGGLIGGNLISIFRVKLRELNCFIQWSDSIC